MAMFERSVLGLDLGSHGLKAVELKVSPRSLSPGQFRIHPRVDASAPLADHLQRFVGMHHLPTGQVACALPASLLDEQAGVSRESLIARRYSFFEMLRAMEALVSEVRGALQDAPPSELAALQWLFNQLRFAARSRETLLAQAARLPG